MHSPKYYADMQKKRVNRYPANRIPFLGIESAADADKATFKAYRYGYISLTSACERIARSNYLPAVTEEQFLNEYRICGYQRYAVEDDDDEEDRY